MMLRAKQMVSGMSDRLRTAMREKTLVRLARRFETTAIRGYVLDVGPKMFLLALVSDRLWLDGYECFRISDVKALEPDPYCVFAEAALRLRGEDGKLSHPPVSVANLRELLRSAAAAFPLVSIQTEMIDSEVCWIGQVLWVDDLRVSLLKISPDASWDADPETHRLRDITRVCFGGDYEDALHLVGGSPPT